MGTQTTVHCAQAECSGLLGWLQSPNWVKVCLVSTVFFLPVSIVPRIWNGNAKEVVRYRGLWSSGCRGSSGAIPVRLLFVACLTSQQHASVSQGRISSDNSMCCHTEIEVADQTLHLAQSLYADTGLTSPSTDPITPGAWQGSHWSANFKVTGMTRPRKNPAAVGLESGIFHSRGGRFNH